MVSRVPESVCQVMVKEEGPPGPVVLVKIRFYFVCNELVFILASVSLPMLDTLVMCAGVGCGVCMHGKVVVVGLV